MLELVSANTSVAFGAAHGAFPGAEPPQLYLFLAIKARDIVDLFDWSPSLEACGRIHVEVRLSPTRVEGGSLFHVRAASNTREGVDLLGGLVDERLGLGNVCPITTSAP